MKEEYTPLLRAAMARGCEVQVGTDMQMRQTKGRGCFADPRWPWPALYAERAGAINPKSPLRT
jgi:hypothetical protein